MIVRHLRFPFCFAIVRYMSDYQLRLSAAQRGEIKYQGRECANNHGGIRYTSNGLCCECVKEKSKTRQDAIRNLLRTGGDGA